MARFLLRSYQYNTLFQDRKKTRYLRYNQTRLNLKPHFTQQRLFLLIKMLQPAETKMHATVCEKITKTYSGFRNPNTSSPV